MTFHRGFKRRILPARQTHNLPTPAKPHNSPDLDIRIRLVVGLDESRDAGRGRTRRAVRLEEVAELLALLGGFRWVPGDVCGLAVEEVRHEYLVRVVLVRGGEDVGALEGLLEVAEDVGDVEEGFGGGLGAGDICGMVLGCGNWILGVRWDRTVVHVADGLVFAFGFVAFGDDGRDAAAGCAVYVLCHCVVSFDCG